MNENIMIDTRREQTSRGSERVPALESKLDEITQAFQQQTGKPVSPALRGIATNFGQHVDSNNFVLDFDIYWKAVGISLKHNAITKLKKLFKGKEATSFKIVNVRDMAKITQPENCSDSTSVLSHASLVILKNEQDESSSVATSDSQKVNQKQSGSAWGGHNCNKYFLTPASMKKFLVKCNTDEGDLAADYFLEVESAARKLGQAIGRGEVELTTPIGNLVGTFEENRDKNRESTKRVGSLINEAKDKNTATKFGAIFPKVHGAVNKAVSGMTKKETRQRMIDQDNFDPKPTPKANWTPRDYHTDVQASGLNFLNNLLHTHYKKDHTTGNMTTDTIMDTTNNLCNSVAGLMKNADQHYKYQIRDQKRIENEKKHGRYMIKDTKMKKRRREEEMKKNNQFTMYRYFPSRQLLVD